MKKQELKQRTLNLVSGSKGGIGKTLIAKTISEYFRFEKVRHVVIDTDAANSSLIQCKFFKAIPFKLTNSDNLISSEQLPELITEYADAENLVIDSGANTYLPWLLFIKDNLGREIIESLGFKIIVHVPVVPGPMYVECVKCLNELAKADPNLDIAVWLNNGFKTNSSPISYYDFKNTDVVLDNQNIKYIVELPTCDPIRRRVLENINNNNYAMSEIADTPNDKLQKFILDGRSASIADKLIIKMYRKLIFDAINNAKEKLFIFKDMHDYFEDMRKLGRQFAGEE